MIFSSLFFPEALVSHCQHSSVRLSPPPAQDETIGDGRREENMKSSYLRQFDRSVPHSWPADGPSLLARCSKKTAEMSSTSKRHKLFDDQSERPCEDRFSSLPSSLIGYILSFLPTKDAVATSVLSTTWKEFWTLITRLYFSDKLLLRPQNKKNAKSLQAEFADFVNRVLLVGKFSSIDTFCLHCGQKYDPRLVNSWLALVLKCNVQELDVSVPLKDYIVLPTYLFTCRTLVKLKLGKHIFMNVPGSVSLPCVKIVDLAWVEFQDDDSVTRFLSGCPVLNTLRLKKCIGKNVNLVKVSVPSLTSLTIEFLCHKEGFSRDIKDGLASKLRIVLDTPLLQHIFIQDHVPHGFVLKNLHQLTTAGITIDNPLGKDTKSMVPFEDVHYVAVNDLLKGISKVRKLNFFTVGINRKELPTFENLRELVFGTHPNVKVEVLLKLVEASPLLNSLRVILDPVYGIGAENDEDWLEMNSSQGVCWCLLFRLKTIEIVNSGGSHKEVGLVGYFLKNARVLEKLTVEVMYNVEPVIVRELLLTLPRASGSCQIEVL